MRGVWREVRGGFAPGPRGGGPDVIPRAGEIKIGRAGVGSGRGAGDDEVMRRDGFFGVVASPQSWRELAWLLLGLPLGVLWGTWAVTMYSLGLGLLIIWAGLPVFAATQVTMRWVGSVERAVTNAVLGEAIGRPSPMKAAARPGAVGALMAPIRDAHAWRVAAWSSVRLVTGPVGFVLAIGALVAPVAAAGLVVLTILFVVGVLRITTINDTVLVGEDYWWTVPASVVVGVVAVPLLWWISKGFASLHRHFARWALGPCEGEELRSVTERAERAEEQLRIDQELHDSIGHMITMNVIQAGAGAHVFDTDPEFARQALRNIEERGRAAMGELDRIIAAIRGDEPETRAPLPGIADLGRLIVESRAAGMSVDAVIEPPSVPPAVGRAVFAIVREALTNAARHAPGASVHVLVAEDADALGIAVVNGPVPGMPDAPSPRDEASDTASRPAGSRRGLKGLSDRVTLLGGRSTAGPEGEGWAVRALLPLDAALAPTGPTDSPWAGVRERVNA